MVDFADFLPIRRETLASIRARYNADAVAGDPPERAIDLTPGGHAWDLSQALLLEVERLWDFAATEVPAVAFLTYAWGDYLDLHGEVLDTPRKAAVAASGVETFTGTPGTLIGTGVRVSAVQTDPDTDPVSAVTTASGTIPAGGSIDLPIVAEQEGTQGNVAPNTLTEPGTPVDGLSAVTNAQPLSNGQEVESDESYRVRLLLKYVTADGASSPTDLQRQALAYPGVGFVTVEPNWIGPGFGRIVVMDADNNPVGPAVVTGFQQQIDPPTASTTLRVNTTFPLAGGTVGVVSTTGFAATGPNMRFYAGGHAFSYTGTTGLTVPTGVTATPSTTGGTMTAGTRYYRVTALNAAGETVGSTEVSAVTTGATGSVALSWGAVTGATSYRIYRGTVAGAEAVFFTSATTTFTDTGAAGTAGTVPVTDTSQSFTGVAVLDPGGFTGTLNAGTPVIQSGQGGGGGDVAMGAEIIVATGSLLIVNVAATITFRSGYSLDGAGGTIATRDAIVAALTAYIDNLPPGEDVILNHVESAFFTVNAVYNVSGVTLNGVAADIPLPTLQVAQLGTVTLS